MLSIVIIYVKLPHNFYLCRSNQAWRTCLSRAEYTDARRSPRFVGNDAVREDWDDRHPCRQQVLFNFSASLVRFAAVARIVVCSQGASGRESPDRPAAEKSRREISVSRPDFWYNNYAKARRSNSNRRGKTDFPRGERYGAITECAAIPSDMGRVARKPEKLCL